MNIGTEKKGEVIALVVLLAVAGLLLWRSLAPSAPAAAGVAAVPAAAAGADAPAPRTHADPTLHLDKLARLRAIHYNGNGRNLFRFGPAPITAAERMAAAGRAGHGAAGPPPPPPGPPPPPPIPLQFYGYAQASGQPKKIFLRMGQDNFVVSEGDTIAHRYLIENIGKVSVRVKDLETQSEQELPLQQG